MHKYWILDSKLSEISQWDPQYSLVGFQGAQYSLRISLVYCAFLSCQCYKLKSRNIFQPVHCPLYLQTWEIIKLINVKSGMRHQYQCGLGEIINNYPLHEIHLKGSSGVLGNHADTRKSMTPLWQYSQCYSTRWQAEQGEKNCIHIQFSLLYHSLPSHWPSLQEQTRTGVWIK